MSVGFGLLGPFQVRGAYGHLTVPTGKLRVLLAGLLLEANKPVSQALLIDRLWEDRLPVDPPGALYTLVRRLRRTLADDVKGGRVLRSESSGYSLAVPGSQVDALLFDELIEAAHSAEAAVTRISLLTEALALWRGQALIDVESDALRRTYGDVYEERRLHAYEQRADLQLADGRYAEVVTTLRPLTEEHPTRERLWGQRMIAMHRTGKTDEAIRAYARLQRVLSERFGLEPGPDLQRLHDDLRISLRTGTRTAGKSVPSSETACQLPPDIADFIGRGVPVAQIVDAMSSLSATGVIVGLAGMGKSTLAVHAAHLLAKRFADGQLFVRMRGSSNVPRDPRDILSDLLLSIGPADQGIPADMAGRLERVQSLLAGRSVLLVLDDAASLDQLQPLLQLPAGCGVLITSRFALRGLPGARMWRLGGLTLGESRELLGRLAGSRRVDVEPDAVAAISRACGGQPLALRIVAARLALRPSASLTCIAEKLRDESLLLDELELGPVNVRDGVASSYATLPADAARSLRMLALLPRMSVAEWVVAALVDVPDGQTIVDQLEFTSLLVIAEDERNGERRYLLDQLSSAYTRELARGDDPIDKSAAVRRYVQKLLFILRSVCATIDRPAPGPSLDPPGPGVRPIAVGATQGFSVSNWLAVEMHAISWAMDESCRRGWYGEAAALTSGLIQAVEKADESHVEVIMREHPDRT